MSTGLLGEDVVALSTEKQDETHLSSVPTTSATHSDTATSSEPGGGGTAHLFRVVPLVPRLGPRVDRVTCRPANRSRTAYGVEVRRSSGGRSEDGNGDEDEHKEKTTINLISPSSLSVPPSFLFPLLAQRQRPYPADFSRRSRQAKCRQLRGRGAPTDSPTLAGNKT